MSILIIFTLSAFTIPLALASGSSIEFNISSLKLANGEQAKHNDICYIPQLSNQQIYIYKELHKLHLSDTELTRDRLEKQERAYKNILRNSKLETSGFADQIAEKYFITKLRLIKEQSAFFHAVLYKILLKKQRNSLIDCL